MKISTKTGDKGTTGIAGGIRVDKDDIRIECNGTIDELNSNIGLLRSKLDEKHVFTTLLHEIQLTLFSIMGTIAKVASTREHESENDIVAQTKNHEKWINETIEKLGDKADYFIVPGGNEISALCHVIRTITRRAERRLISLNKVDKVEDYLIQYFNRLSDLFFIMAHKEILDKNIYLKKYRKFTK